MVHFPVLLWWKVGITGESVVGRAKQIDKALWGFPVPIMAILIPGAYDIEQALHRMMKAWKAPKFYKGDGHTEWFWCFPVIPLLAAELLYWWVLDFLIYRAIGFSIIETLISLIELTLLAWGS